jgi:predicted XRE-type DNA-binding protein
MRTPEHATIESLRRDVALQIARFAAQIAVSQVAAAKQLGIPQPTLSKIVNGRVTDLSLELLIRVAVRSGVPLALQTGLAPEEAGAFITAKPGASARVPRSRLADEARDSITRSERRLTPSQRLEAFLEHNQLIGALHQAGRAAEAERERAVRDAP